MKRRDVLKVAGAAAGTLATHGLWRSVASAEKLPEIKEYRTLGKTGQRISDLSLGGGGLNNPKTVAEALKMGITYIDTAPDYGRSEDTIGRGWKMSGVAREKFHLTTKICRPGGYPGHLPSYRQKASKAAIIEAVEGSLKRLRTDYIDNLFVHAVGERRPWKEDGEWRFDADRLKDPEMLEAVAELKKAGKVKFLGMSSHGPHGPPGPDGRRRSENSVRVAVESGLYDVIMPAYNLYAWKGLRDILKLAQEKQVGVIAMKVLRGGKQAKAKGVLPKRGIPQHNVFKWVWSNPAVAGLIITMPTLSRVKFFMKASGQKLAMHEGHELESMLAATSTDVCRIGCGDCVDKCSRNVDIPTAFRADYYDGDLGDTLKARALYDGLRTQGHDASACAGCTNQTCLGACTHGVNIRAGLLDVHSRLGAPSIG